MTMSCIKKIEDIAKTIFNDKDLKVTLDKRKIFQSQIVTLHLNMDGKTEKASSPMISSEPFDRKIYTESEDPKTYLFVKLYSKYTHILNKQLQEFFTRAEQYLKDPK